MKTSFLRGKGGWADGRTGGGKIEPELLIFCGLNDKRKKYQGITRTCDKDCRLGSY